MVRIKFDFTETSAALFFTLCRSSCWPLEVRAVLLTSGGSGYKEAPVVAIAPPADSFGQAATAEALLGSNGAVAGIRLIDPGRGYSEV